ncbi:EAL domain-containing protein [Ferrimonas balearica]|uniref:GGDEF/EAL domain-containing response regulator n=1 Tax=Ferrimonas balearica TaxID=44012 RepID=UPI002D800181|nr:EAL domain-containing protein [Ferrimonas balearica]MBY6016325.1 EAL domain-containing protein [Halomonas denitrificans]MBY6095405.1 EAL domain-containing protein [Ferrimonas balearica]
MSESASHHVVIVNDDPFQQRVLVNRVQRLARLQCRAVSSIQALLERPGSLPLVVIVDVDLGRFGNGYEHCQQLAALPNLCGVVVYSACCDDIAHSVHNLFQSAGILNVCNLSKQLPVSSLLERIANLTGKPRVVRHHPVSSDKAEPQQQSTLSLYQPQYSADGTLTSFEVLARFLGPKGEVLMPDRVIPKLVAIGQITPFTYHFIGQSLAEVSRLTDQQPMLSFNIDYSSLENKTFAKRIIDIIRGQDYPCGRITLEVTETGFSRSDITYQNLISLRLAGVNISIDDFDLSQATVNEFLEFPFNEVKFDKSMLKRASEENKVRELMLHFCQTCQRLGTRVVFEGIEKEQDRTMALSLGANRLQGYWYQRPMPVEQAIELVNIN